MRVGHVENLETCVPHILKLWIYSFEVCVPQAIDISSGGNKSQDPQVPDGDTFEVAEMLDGRYRDFSNWE